jgi:hypothetical protein
MISFGKGSSTGDFSIENVANRDINHYHYSAPTEKKDLTEKREIDFGEALLIASSFSELLGYFLVVRLFELLGVNKRRSQRGDDKASYYALLSVDRKRIRRFIQGFLGKAYNDVYIKNTPFQLADVLSAGIESDTAYEKITMDCDAVYNVYIDVQTEDLDTRVVQERLENTMLHLFEQALRNPKQAIVRSLDFYFYKEKYDL